MDRQLIKFISLLDSEFRIAISTIYKTARGGYLVIRSKKDGRVLFVVQIGEIPPEKVQKYFDYALEKGARLYIHLPEGHISSFQSANEAKNQFGGAVLIGDYILSFSGIPLAAADEATLLQAAVKMGYTTDEYVLSAFDPRTIHEYKRLRQV
ncbi:MAG: hypothetical protein NUV82_01555 [Candidatus Komeilibacteria bacterium]|nr:hypothetical protein [Candidatus Komeilibacteria bacterium]